MSADKANLDTHKTVETWQDELRLVAHSEKIPDLMRFFKTGRGEYGEGDIFIGIYVPDNRRISKGYAVLSLCEIGRMLDSPVHEFRLAGFLALVEKYRKSPQSYKGEIADFYFANCHKANNWDLVDLSTEYILGVEYANGNRLEELNTLINSDNLWRQRVAMVAMLTPVRQGILDLPLSVADMLLEHPHNLMQKAVGWVLREVGKKDMARLIDYININIHRISPVTLSCATEKMSKDKRDALRLMRRQYKKQILPVR